MKSLYAVAAFMLVAGTASAGETGIINRAGPYEAQMRFYLHPAHGFPDTPETAAQGARAVDAKRSAGAELAHAGNAAPAAAPAVRASHRVRNRSDRLG